MLRKFFSKSFLTIAAIFVIAYLQGDVLKHQDDFIGKQRWKSLGVITWDIQEYYMYLPATFIYYDPAMHFMDTIKGPARNHFWVAKSATGKWVGRFTTGMAIAYAPFFFISDVYALRTGAARDGFSPPYQLGLYLCGFIYSLIGFLFLGKALRIFYNDYISALTLICIGLGTNLFYYTTTEGAMSHAVLFCLFSIFVYLTIRWHQSPKFTYIIALSLVFGLAVLIRPTTILVSLIFLLYGISNSNTFNQKIRLFIKYKWQLASGFLVLMLFALPQIIYWKSQTGQFIYYSYTGEHFFFNHPRIFKGLFSFRKGWLIYTPMAAFFFLGLIFIKKYARSMFLPSLIFLVMNIYVVLSWWCWWYGGGFGLRAFIESYAILSFSLAALLNWCFQRGWLSTVVILSAAAFFIRLNLFQSKQYREGMLHWDSMSKEMYTQTFLKLGYVKNADKLIDSPDYEAAKKGLNESTIDHRPK